MYKKRKGDVVGATLVFLIVGTVISGWAAWESHRQASFAKAQMLQNPPAQSAPAEQKMTNE